MVASTTGWQRVRIPPVERVVLADIAARRGISDEEALAEIIRREAVAEACRVCCKDEAHGR